MNREEIIKWLELLKNDIGKAQYSDLWHYEQVIDAAINELKTQISNNYFNIKEMGLMGNGKYIDVTDPKNDMW